MERDKAPDDYLERRDRFQHKIWKGEGPLLEHLDIELTERCNNNCIHCSINLPERDSRAIERELPTGEWKGVLDQAANLGVLSVRFTGGEPLLRQDFEDLYLYARRLGLRVRVFTNGQLITPRLADLFSRIPPLEKIEITVYGMSPGTYEAVTRVRGSFSEFRRGVDLLRERQVPFAVKGALMPQNRQDLREFEEWTKTIPGMDSPPSYAMFFELRARRDSDKKNRRIETLRMSPEEGLAILTRDPGKYLDGMRQFCSKFLGSTGDRLFPCDAGRSVCIDAYGLVQPCLSLRDPRLCYNIRQGSLRDALTRWFPGLRDMKAENPDYLMRCARCFLRGLCEQCPAKSWSEQGTLDTPVEYLCQVAHVQARYLGLLREGEQSWNVNDGPGRVRQMIEHGERH